MDDAADGRKERHRGSRKKEFYSAYAEFQVLEVLSNETSIHEEKAAGCLKLEA